MTWTMPSTGPDRSGGPSPVDPRKDPLPPRQPPQRPRHSTTLVVALVLAVVVIAALVVALVSQRDGDDGTVTEPPAAEEPVTTAPTTDGTVPTGLETAVFPDAAGTARFDDPVALARTFAVDVLGFTDPVVGDLMQGDSRSGEVEVRPDAGGPVTIVLVRQLGPDDSWWVVGSMAGGTP